MKKELFYILTIFLVFSCDVIKINHDDDYKIGLSKEDQEIAEKAYSKTYMYPEGFNYEKNLEGSIYYENTVSIRSHQDTWIELNTNDKQQAKDWSEISSQTSAYYRDLVAERETEKFFEFKRVYSVRPNDVILSRVHKSSYFIPIYDKFKKPNGIGSLKVAINKETVKEFIEYIWANYCIAYSGKVLENSLFESSDTIRYNLKSVNVIYGDWGLCDIIEVSNFDFYVDKKSGMATFESNKIKEIKGICR